MLTDANQERQWQHFQLYKVYDSREPAMEWDFRFKR